VRNIKLIIEYDGTNYLGWQVQNTHHWDSSRSKPPKTIQETIEKTLQNILQERIRLISSGRTDAGVHALAQVANFKTKSDINLGKLHKALNSLLPEDISIVKAEEKNINFHSRFYAKSKVYRYTLLNRTHRSALLRNTVYYYPYPLEIKIMRRESKALLGRHNFKSFQASDKKERLAIRTIKKIEISKDKDLILIDIEADGFLYYMVRNIVGTLIEVGRGKFGSRSLKRILLSQDRKLAGPTVPAKGLCLLKVKY